MLSPKHVATVESKILAQPQSEDTSPERTITEQEKKPLKRRIREILWDSFDRTPEERWFIHKIDFFILTWASLSYFSKNLNTNNVSKSNSYKTRMIANCVSGTDKSVACRQCLRLRHEGGSQHRWERVPNAHDYVDNVRLCCEFFWQWYQLTDSIVAM